VLIDSKDRFLTQAAPMIAEPASPEPFAQVTVERPPGAPDVAWAPDDAAGESTAIVRQTLRSARVVAPSRLVIVVDGSGAMREAAAEVAAALAALPRTLPVAITIAGDDVVSLRGRPVELGGAEFTGGTDSVPALLAAWDLAATQAGSALLWIHGPQPVLLASPEPLRQRLERRRDGPSIYTFAALGGENRLLAALSDVPNVQTVPRLAPGGEDLARFLRGLDGTGERIVAERGRDAATPAGLATATRTSGHLARLWALDRIEATADRKEALALAARYRLVTPVSGAVVLETQAQYDQAGLTPSDDNHAAIPTVPEPGTWALIISLALVVLLARRRLAVGRHAT
jgi:hypothetical protein